MLMNDEHTTDNSGPEKQFVDEFTTELRNLNDFIERTLPATRP